MKSSVKYLFTELSGCPLPQSVKSTSSRECCQIHLEQAQLKDMYFLVRLNDLYLPS